MRELQRFLVAACALAVAGCGGTASACSEHGYQRAAGNIQPGVQLFYNYGTPIPQPMGTIERIDDDKITVRYSDGGPGSLSRKYIVSNDSIVVKC